MMVTKQQVTFSDALQAAMHADPDIIIIAGAVRDSALKDRVESDGLSVEQET